MALYIRKQRRGRPSKMVFPNASTSLSWITSEPFSSSPNFPYRFGPKPSNMPSTQRTVRLPQSSRAKLLMRHSGVTNPTSVTFVFSVPSATCTTTLLLGANSTRAHFPLSSSAIPPRQKLGGIISLHNASQERHRILSSMNAFKARCFITTLRGS